MISGSISIFSSTAVHPIYEVLWKLKLPTNILIFIWRVARDIIPSMAALRYRHLCSDSCCPQCGVSPETSIHALRFCPFVADVGSSLGFSFPDQDPLRQAIDWINDQLRSLASPICLLFGISLWHLWWFRNSLLHTGRSISAMIKYSRIIIYHSQLISLVASPLSGPFSGLPCSSPQDMRYVRFQFDGSFLPSRMLGAGGGVALDSSGASHATFVVPFPLLSSPLMAKA